MNARFGEFRLDSGTRQLFRTEAEVHISPKAFELLRILMEGRPNALSKTELSERLWPRTFVSDANLSVLVAEVRNALGDPAKQPRFVRTVYRFGYAFSGNAVEMSPAAPGVATGGRSYWLIEGVRRIELVDRDTIIGRDPHAGAWLDLPSVSRQHARLRIDGDTATLEDLESKNGTFVGGEPVRSPARLQDGDEIRLGSVLLRFRVWSADGTTRSQDSSEIRR